MIKPKNTGDGPVPTNDEPESLPAPPPLPKRRAKELVAGPAIDPIQRLQVCSPEQLETVVEYWIREALGERYAKVERVPGSGDKGRDVVAFAKLEKGDPWDNFQCKRLADPLQPNQVWIEIGKLVYWTMVGSYTAPRRYSFVAPRGGSPATRDLLEDAEKIRTGLRENWAKHCSSLCPLAEVTEYLDNFVFPEFDVVRAGDIVEALKDRAIFPFLFGGGLIKPRPDANEPPDKIDPYELPYITALVEAYDDHCDEDVADPEVAFGHEEYGPHLRESRHDFYSAESLREFSKDVLVEFDGLQSQIADGVKYVVAQQFASGYDRVLAVCTHATQVQLDDHPLADVVRPEDRSGMCHQLANEKRLRWRRQ